MSANTTLGRTSSKLLMAASPLFTSTIWKFPSAKICVTRRRIVGLSSATKMVRRIGTQLRKRGGHCPPLRDSQYPPTQRNFFVGVADLSMTFGLMLKLVSPFVLPEPAPAVPVVPPLTGPGAPVSAAAPSSSADDRALVSVGTGGRDLNIPNIFPKMLLSSCGACCARAKATGFGSGIG